MIVALYEKGSYSYSPKKCDLDLKNRTTLAIYRSIEQPLVLEFKALPSHLCYDFLRANNTLLTIIFVDQMETDVEAFLSILEKFIRVIKCTITDIMGIPQESTLTKFYLNGTIHHC